MISWVGALTFILLVSLCPVLIGATDEDSRDSAKTRRDVNQANARKSPRSRCVSCSVNGKLYDGHSRFQYEEGCNRFRCVCRCNGSWECPARYTENICERQTGDQDERRAQEGSAASAGNQRSDGRCRSCIVNSKEHPGRSYFTHVQGCVTIDNCMCYCNGSWVCPPERARNTCGEGGAVNGVGILTVDLDNSHSSSSSGSKSSSGSTGTSREGYNVDRSRDRNELTGARQSKSGCQDCSALGKLVAGNSYFELEDGCRKMRNCICHCNGSWNCPDRYVENTCRPDDSATLREQQSGCRSCSVQGKTFPGNQYFQLTTDCVEYNNCICNCNGSWQCPPTGARNICEQGRGNVDKQPSSTCRQCEVNDQVFYGNTYFEMTEGCIEYKNCICRCDGSWICPPEGARNKCQERKEEDVDTSSCRTCEVYGSTFPGNQYFQVKQDCTEYRNCVCHCNGTWMCPGDSAVNVCESKGNSVSTSDTTDDGSRTSIIECSSCSVYGQTFKGGDYFDVIHECTSYRNCICRCNGSWTCSNRFATNICNNEPRRNSESKVSDERTDPRSTPRPTFVASTASTQCRLCNAKNKLVRGNSYFEMTDGCKEFQQCFCNCDGSWECPPQFAKDICTESNRTGISATTCSNCVANGKIVRGNSYFELIDGCTRFTSCRCNCNGTWDCPQERAQNICFSNTLDSDNACSLCDSRDGRVHQPNSQFKLTENCFEYSCDCFCNGSWSCPANRTRWACTDRCRQCDVNGRIVENNTQFTHKTGCLEYTCSCHCNGSWSCPGSSVRNTCPAGVRDGCRECKLSPTEVYVGESDFVLKKDCYHYKCRCNCDGSYSCPGKDARNVCRGEVLGGCRNCEVSQNEIYPGEADFTLRKDCLHYECKCNCNGSWECPSEKIRNICLGEVPGGCRVCRVSETENYRADSIFDLRRGCINYKCMCHCNGSYSCPGEDARDVCKGEIPGGCRSCEVGENYYPGNSNFEMVENCIHYKCKCDCDGGYSCPGNTARRVCQAEAEAKVPACKTCKISESEQFTGNSTFFLERGCTRYECECSCDGNWQCPPGKSRDVCARQTSRPTNPSRCNPCKISNQVYPGNTAFKFTRGCSQFDCKCECSGRSVCDHKTHVNICATGEKTTTEKTLTYDASSGRKRPDYKSSGSSQDTSRQGSSFTDTETQSRETSSAQDQYSNRINRNRTTVDTNSDSNCRPCNADGRIIQPNQMFSLDRGCLQFTNCKCNCDGIWNCVDEINRCDLKQNSAVPQGARSYRTDLQSSTRQEVDASSWVYVDGVDTSYKTGDDKTGGGYVVQVDTKYSPTNTGRSRSRQQLEHLEERPSSSSIDSLSILTSGASQDTFSSSSSEVNKETNQCIRCQVDEKTYPSGANFDMRRGCVIYKCLCLCNGNYRCRLTSDNECSLQDKQNTCSNCLYEGMVFPGNMSFTVREGCKEKQCTCNCDGTHACHSTQPISACTDATAYTPGSIGNGNFYHVPGGPFPISTGYITNTGRVVYQSACTTCVSSGSGPVVYQVPVLPTFGEGGGGFTSTEHRFNVDQGFPRESCSGCLIDGQAKNGNTTFTFEKDCIDFDCYCACGGSWKCAGRLAIGCTPGFAPETVPHTPGCRNCMVHGTSYPSNARFSLRQGCDEYQCSCNCDGGWSCPSQHPVNRCPSTPTRSHRGNVMDPQIARDDRYVADQGTSRTEDIQLGDRNSNHGDSKQFKVSVATCYDCEVRGVSYPAQSKFFLREGCIQRICDCHCNKSWSCSDNTVDICKTEKSDQGSETTGQCRDCRIGSDVYISEKDFQINNECYQQNCYCYCNGTYDCPRDRVKNICSIGVGTSAGERTDNDRQLKSRIHQALLTKENGDVIVAGKVPGCKECVVDGEKVEALVTFVKQFGCYESLCQCLCNGKAVCPPSASVNVCELKDKLPMHERKGCQVGQRTHLTRVFAHVENCIQRTCVCHDNGTWSCKRTANDIRVC